MYLDENEVRDLFTNLLVWLRLGGYFFFRESCYHQSGNVTSADLLTIQSGEPIDTMSSHLVAISCQIVYGITSTQDLVIKFINNEAAFHCP